MAPVPTASSSRIAIDIVSDTVCPWCMVGKRRLEQAVKQVPGLEVEVRWHPYQLNPDAPLHGVNKLDMYKAKFGEARVQAMVPYMTKTFAELGVKYSMGGLTGNTFNSHRLLAWAHKEAGWQKQNALVEELFMNYFSQEKYINDEEVLLAAVSKVGLDVAGAKAVLAGERPDVDQEVRAQLSAARREGITGVPFFTINDKYHLSGAQPSEEFIAIFNKLLESSKVAAVSTAGPEATACSRDTCL